MNPEDPCSVPGCRACRPAPLGRIPVTAATQPRVSRPIEARP